MDRTSKLVKVLKTDSVKNEIDWAKIELEAASIDAKNEIDLEKLNMAKQKSDLENEKLKFEIRRLKNDKLFTTSEGTAIKISDIISMEVCENTRGYAFIHIKNKNHYVFISKNEHAEIMKKINEK